MFRTAVSAIDAGAVALVMTFTTRRANPPDADDIAVAHRDSIRSLGAGFYPPDVVDDWADGLNGDLYIRAMEAERSSSSQSKVPAAGIPCWDSPLTIGAKARSMARLFT